MPGQVGQSGVSVAVPGIGPGTVVVMYDGGTVIRTVPTHVIQSEAGGRVVVPGVGPGTLVVV